jgi:polyphosphate kinase
VVDRAGRFLVNMLDRTRPAAERCDVATAFSHELDVAFTSAHRLSRAHMHNLVTRYDQILHDDLVPILAGDGVAFPRWEELSSIEQARMQRHFHRSTFPLITPIAVDSTHPLPNLPSLTLSVGIRVDGRLVLVTMSPHVPRLLEVSSGRYLTVESLVAAMLPRVLVGVQVAEYTALRVTRSTHTAHAVRLEVEQRSSDVLVNTIAGRLSIPDGDVYRLTSSLAMGDPLSLLPRGHTPARRALGVSEAATGTRTETNP